MPRGSKYWTHYGVTAVGLLATTVATLVFWYALREREHSRFENAVQSTEDRIQNRLDTYISALYALRGLFSASEFVSETEFAAYVTQLELQRQYPGIQGIGFSLYVPSETMSGGKASGNYQFGKIWPDGPRSEYTTILYLEPLDRRNRVAIGYDMASDPVRRAAMFAARDSGHAAATGKVTLVQEIDAQKQPGLLIYVPVYDGAAPTTVEERRARLRGFVYGAFRAGDLFAGIFGREREPRLSFEVYDGQQTDEAGLLYRYQAREAGVLTTSDGLTIAGHTWTIVYRSRRELEDASSGPLIPGMVAFGALANLVLFVLSRSQLRARNRAESAEASMETQRNDLNALFMRVPAGVAVLNARDLRFELVNPMIAAFTSGRAAIGARLEDAYPGPQGEHLAEMLRLMIESREPFVARELALPRGDGSEAFVSGSYQPLHDNSGQIASVFAFTYEVTEQVLARRRLEALALDLSRTADQLKGAVRVRDDFLSIAGHELRTPLAAMMLQVQGLLRQVSRGEFGGGDPNLVERLQKAERHVIRLDRLVSELLDVSRIAAGRLQLQLDRLDLGDIVCEVTDRFSDTANAAGCQLVMDVQPGVTGTWDRTRLEQVTVNLLGNALKYGAGKPVHVTVERRAESAALVVRDFGIGVPESDRERIFERYERAVSDRHYGGLGLGLWITRRIVEALGGEIRLERIAGPGSCFVVELPYNSPPVSARPMDLSESDPRAGEQKSAPAAG